MEIIKKKALKKNMEGEKPTKSCGDRPITGGTVCVLWCCGVGA